ncbi:hypothetical protein GCM10010171_43170 [Actinokineospora fastidiosa]|uniref:Uncharacterized protein n=1 Tax=Actinokineospora fastidiosa TaxID=1816 RepID=A0A918LFM9_9PSEU|nr:hypothetical protein GCM10010171_43170 [Actinokineospora fastidiosa]
MRRHHGCAVPGLRTRDGVGTGCWLLQRRDRQRLQGIAGQRSGTEHRGRRGPTDDPALGLRERSFVVTGVEKSFLQAYREGSFHYLLIAADKVGH